MMTLEPILAASGIIQLHVLAAVVAMLLGPLAIWRRSRDWLHRGAGVMWVAAMLVTAGSSLMIHEARMIGPFSVIHLLSLLTLFGLWRGVRALWRGDGRGHGRAMRALYVQALLIAGVFTFLPGRRMSTAFFGDAPFTGLGLMAALATGVGVLIWRAGRRVGRRVVKA